MYGYSKNIIRFDYITGDEIIAICLIAKQQLKNRDKEYIFEKELLLYFQYIIIYIRKKSSAYKWANVLTFKYKLDCGNIKSKNSDNM